MLQVDKGESRLHGDGEIVHGMVDHLIEVLAAEYRMVGIQCWSPVQAGSVSTGDPGGGVLMPLAYQGDQLGSGCRGMAHGTMVP